MRRSVEEIRADLARERRELVDSTQRLRGQLAGTLDVRSRFGRRAIITVGAAFVALLLVVRAVKVLLAAASRLVAAKVRSVVA